MIDDDPHDVTRKISTRLGDLQVQTEGSGGPVVLWHSLFVDSRTWHLVREPLAAAHRNNREIAGELFVSTRTVEGHLAVVYRKLDIRGRAELAHRVPFNSAVASASPARPVPGVVAASRLPPR